MSRINFDDDENPEREYPTFQADDTHTYQDDFALRAMRHRARQQPAGIAPMYPLYLRNHPSWSGNNELGFEIGFQPDANNRQMVLKMGEWGPPEVWSAMLAMELPPDVTIAPGGFAVSAEVQAGSGGTVDTFLLDWTIGTTFSVVCNALIINAIYSNTVNVPEGIRLRAIIGRKPLFGSNPSNSLQLDVAGGGGFEQISIPKYAKNVQILPAALVGLNTSPYDPLVRYTVQTAPTATAPIASLNGDQVLALGAKFDLPGNGAHFFRIDNPTGAVSSINVRFGLAL